MKKILVAEDEQNIREFVVINLKRAGYDCVEAASGEEALRVYGIAVQEQYRFFSFGDCMLIL